MIPGPAVTSIVGYALGSGRKTALASVAGMAVGSVIAMSLSLAGVGAVLRASSVAFMALKWAGAAYLVGLGTWTLILSRGRPAADAPPPPPAATRPRAAFLSNLLLGSRRRSSSSSPSPRSSSARTPPTCPRPAILVATFGAVVGCTDTTYALVASHAAQWLRRPGAMLWSKRAGGGVLIAAGVATAAAQT